MSDSDKKKYSSLEELRASDEYKKAGVLGKEKLRVEHFPETNVPSNAEGKNPSLTPEDRPMATRPSAPTSQPGGIPARA